MVMVIDNNRAAGFTYAPDYQPIKSKGDTIMVSKLAQTISVEVSPVFRLYESIGLHMSVYCFHRLDKRYDDGGPICRQIT